jgi:hypothetical protein
MGEIENEPDLITVAENVERQAAQVRALIAVMEDAAAKLEAGAKALRRAGAMAAEFEPERPAS